MPFPQRSHHDGEDYADLLDNLEDAEYEEEEDLVEGVGVDPHVGDPPEVVVVRLVLVGNQW